MQISRILGCGAEELGERTVDQKFARISNLQLPQHTYHPSVRTAS